MSTSEAVELSSGPRAATAEAAMAAAATSASEPRASASAAPGRRPSTASAAEAADREREISERLGSDLAALGIPGAPRTVAELDALDDQAIRKLVSGLNDSHLARLISAGRDSGWLEAPAPLAWNNVFYEGPAGEALVNGVSGYARPGQLVAVMGGGVSQLLHVLGGHAVGQPQVRGEVLLNCMPPNKDYQRLVSYVPRVDTHQPLLTVRETVRFSSALRFHSGASDAVRNLYSELVLKQLGLDRVADSVVGGGGVRGISGGEMRRLSVAVEMVSGASVLVADLPTNGLDSSTAIEFVRTAKAVARTGSTQVMSVVSAGQELWDEFDTVLCLVRGQPAYFGPPAEAVAFLGRAGFRRADGDESNDPDFVSAVLRRPEAHYDGAGPAEDALVAAFLNSRQRAELAAALATDMRPRFRAPAAARGAAEAGAADPAPPRRPRKYNRGLVAQAAELVRRDTKTLTRDKAAFYGSFMRSVVVALLMGTTFLDLGDSQADARSRMSLMFFAIMTMVGTAFQIVPLVALGRPLFLHQRESYFSPALYNPSFFFASLPWITLETLLFAVIAYPLAGLRGTVFGGEFWFFFVSLLLSYLTSRAFMYVCAISSASAASAQAKTPLFFMISVMVSGFLVPHDQMPAAFEWMHWLSFITWGIRAMAKNEMKGLTFVCQPGEQCLYLSGDDVLSFYSMDDAGGKGTALLMQFVFFAAFSALAMYACVAVSVEAVETGADSGDSQAAPGDAASSHTAKVAPSSTDAPRESTTVTVGAAGSTLRARAALEFRNLSYDVPVPNPTPEDGRGKTVQRRLLTEVSGHAVPGRMIALMGASGAGKSTLLDVLAGKKTGGSIFGDVLVNGKPKDEFFHRYSAYVEQFDSHEPTATVREAVTFSARLRLAGRASERKVSRAVADVLDELELNHVADEVIGSPETGGLAPELRKKVSIAVETVVDPGVLFLDEPTTGLVSAAALGVMQSTRKLANRISVICTIHQPSNEIVELFDDMLLLQPGGRVAYFGPVAGLADYFERNGMGRPPAGCNIADYALDAVRPPRDDAARAALAERNGGRSAADVYEASDRRAEVQAAAKAGVVPKDASLPDYSSVFAAPRAAQVAELVRRNVQAHARDPVLLVTRLFGALFISTIVGTLFWDQGTDPVGHTVRMSVSFILAINPLFSSQALIPGLVGYRLIYHREHTSHTYSVGSFYAARVLVDLPIVAGEALMLTLPAYFMSNLVDGGSGRDFFLILAMVFATSLLGTSFAEFLAASCPTAEVATAALTVAINIQMLLSGFFVVESAIPAGWKWLYEFNMTRFPLSFLSSVSLDTDAVGRATMATFGVDPDDRALYMGIVLAWLVGFRIAGYLAVRFVSYIKR